VHSRYPVCLHGVFRKTSRTSISCPIHCDSAVSLRAHFIARASTIVDATCTGLLRRQNYQVLPLTDGNRGRTNRSTDDAPSMVHRCEILCIDDRPRSGLSPLLRILKLSCTEHAHRRRATGPQNALIYQVFESETSRCGGAARLRSRNRRQLHSHPQTKGPLSKQLSSEAAKTNEPRKYIQF
jgi:hypothetical protein